MKGPIEYDHIEPLGFGGTRPSRQPSNRKA